MNMETLAEMSKAWGSMNKTIAKIKNNSIDEIQKAVINVNSN